MKADQSATLIGNILTNICPFPKAGIVLSAITDHFPIFAQIPDLIYHPKPTSRKLTHRLTSENISRLKENVSVIDWCEVLVMYDSNKYFGMFMEILMHINDEVIPLQTLKYSI